MIKIAQALDIVKKWLAQGRELDKDYLAKDLGNYIKTLEHSCNLGYVILLLFLLFDGFFPPLLAIPGNKEV